MTNLAKSLLSRQVLLAASAKGVEIEVTHTNMETSPRKLSNKVSTSTFVSGTTGRTSGLADVNLPAALHGRRISDSIENYAAHYGLEVVDLLCWTVYKYEIDGDITLSTTLFHDLWKGDIAGFIYESKETLREEFGIKRISPRLKEELGERIQAELNELCEWANSRRYTVSIVSDNEVVASISQYYEDIDTLDLVASELVEEFEECEAA